MKKKRYSTEQMISILKKCEASGQVPDAKRLKELELACH